MNIYIPNPTQYLNLTTQLTYLSLRQKLKMC